MRASRSFFDFVSEPVFGWARVALVVLCVPLILSFPRPLWRISMTAPQYPDGLTLEIYNNRLEAGNQGWDLHEINTLNHYIGMRPITREALRDLDWIPFALGGLVLLALRVAAIGSVRALIDLAMVNLYVAGVSMGRFVYMLYTFGHELDPKAPIHVDPFTPAILGMKKVANFDTFSYPQSGSWLVATFTAGVCFLTLWHLWAGWRYARRAAADAAASGASSPAAAVHPGQPDSTVEAE